MLEPGKIPEKEPQLRIGIILPEDKKETVEINIKNAVNLSVYSGNDRIDPEMHESIIVCSVDRGIEINGIEYDELTIAQADHCSVIILKNVPAGRGFHWNKTIDVKLSGEITVKNVGGYLLLINTIMLEDYIACVATSEMSSECPDNFMKAQTIAARSWMLANVEQKHVHLGFDVCNDDCCQRFQGLNNLSAQSKKAAESTRGMVLIYDGEIADARYSKSCGGITEAFENLWENTPKPYLINAFDGPDEGACDLTIESNFERWIFIRPKSYCSPHYVNEDILHKYLGSVDENASYFRWRTKITQEELTQNIREKCKIDIALVYHLAPVKRGGSGRMRKFVILYFDSTGKKKEMVIENDYQVRKIMHKEFLYSSAFAIATHFENDGEIPTEFEYFGAGWGHGAGMCQIGALGMALHGYDPNTILDHYYPGTEIVKIYE